MLHKFELLIQNGGDERSATCWTLKRPNLLIFFRGVKCLIVISICNNNVLGFMFCQPNPKFVAIRMKEPDFFSILVSSAQFPLSSLLQDVFSYPESCSRRLN